MSNKWEPDSAPTAEDSLKKGEADSNRVRRKSGSPLYEEQIKAPCSGLRFFTALATDVKTGGPGGI
ncbi:hypothetical protein [Pyrobaculum aerophilum]|uniref:hypothetical protein n=1 Tax=Pyrobaculum aerophilum TaxID=13773 RepID=UPI0023F1B48D|nr:hypothetical protein [Pyrobaculum aerophilum]MCX8136270.1 hypothetical protein [Pyrobaculum aerophilum]